MHDIPLKWIQAIQFIMDTRGTTYNGYTLYNLPAVEWYCLPLTINETAPILQFSGTVYL